MASFSDSPTAWEPPTAGESPVRRSSSRSSVGGQTRKAGDNRRRRRYCERGRQPNLFWVSIAASACILCAKIGVVVAMCPNMCSGHGGCGFENVCECEEDWNLVADCSLKSCPSGVSWGSKVCMYDTNSVCYVYVFVGQAYFSKVLAKMEWRRLRPLSHLWPCQGKGNEIKFPSLFLSFAVEMLYPNIVVHEPRAVACSGMATTTMWKLTVYGDASESNLTVNVQLAAYIYECIDTTLLHCLVRLEFVLRATECKGSAGGKKVATTADQKASLPPSPETSL